MEWWVTDCSFGGCDAIPNSLFSDRISIDKPQAYKPVGDNSNAPDRGLHSSESGIRDFAR
jgi:hypothetical protein